MYVYKMNKFLKYVQLISDVSLMINSSTQLTSARNPSRLSGIVAPNPP